MPSKKVIEVLNPSTGESLGEVKSYTANEANDAMARARVAQQRWEAVGLQERIRVIKQFKDRLLDHAEEMSALISRENGKVLQESFQMEVFPVADLCAYFCHHAERILTTKKIGLRLLRHRRSYLHYRPRGLVLVIAPWNFPFSIPYGEVIMALLAGNAVILKPASLTPLACLKGREIFDEIGLDPDLFQVITCPGRVASEMIEQGVDFVNFTGSNAVGTRVAEACGRHMTPFCMELGGKDPAIVLPDADLDLVEGSLVWGAFANAGQVCASIERAYVHESLYDELVERVVDRVQRLTIGDPLADGTDVGAMTDPHQLSIVHEHVTDALDKGAKVLTGGAPIEGPGQFYPPTVLVDVTPEMEAYREETFGPTLPIMKYTEVEDAIDRANDSIYGLDAYVYGKSRSQARRVAEQLEAGTVMINETLITHACPETPWGGVKKSGLGRVHSDDGLRSLSIAYHVNEELIPGMHWSPFWQPYSHRMFETLVGAARSVDHSDLTVRATGLWEMLTNAVKLFRDRRAA